MEHVLQQPESQYAVPKLRFKPNVKKAARRQQQVLKGAGS